VSETRQPLLLGRRVVVTGMAGAGKSTFSRELAARTGLPLVYLDLYRWDPGWVRKSADEFREVQQVLLAGEEWIVDGNVAIDLRVVRADSVVFLDTPWWLCARRAFMRGLRRRRPPLPDGCDDTLRRRLRDEWWLVWRIWLGRRSERDLELGYLSRHEKHVVLHVLRSKREARELLEGLPRAGVGP